VLALVAKFGEPTKSITGAVQNAFGAKFDDRHDHLEAQRRRSASHATLRDLKRSAVSFSTPEGARQAALDALRRASKAPSGLQNRR
jgi:hypothetical protein